MMAVPDTRDTSCSPDLPPNKTPMFSIRIPFSGIDPTQKNLETN